MAQNINTNISSLNAQRNLNTSQNALATSLQRLSSGLRINSAKDDAAGLAISERFTTQIRGLNQATRNANDGISLSQTAEGALGEIGNNLQRIRELAVQSANATNSSSDRAALQAEVSQRIAEIDRVATQTQFNGLNLLDGSFTTQNFQVGANAGQTIAVSAINSARTSVLGQFNGFQVSNGTITGNDATAAASLTLNGPGTVVSLGNVARDAKALAAAINTSGVAGLSATADASVATGTLAALSGSEVNESLSITINGINVAWSSGTAQATSLANFITAANLQSASTGVTAVDTGSGVRFTAADGRNITFGALTGATEWTAAETGLGGLASTTTAGTIDITYQAPTGSNVTGITFTLAGLGITGANQAVAATGTALSIVNISTVDGANTAMTAVDQALNAVNNSRASLGALQNRFESVIANLATTAENLTASRSRIQDADFAMETANLTRAQILQQAGVAMLAQANALPNNVLTLLRG